ncbi:hypothetical protein Taro_010992 [Colocasia esculenta]|uniref:Uncharacterized protein n=1 Tax=Colocasia esculenta TaxID=4460 RepID=A0A843U9D4_COLES|nr:hypothetical protein [Colocasia esculenta]
MERNPENLEGDEVAQEEEISEGNLEYPKDDWEAQGQFLHRLEVGDIDVGAPPESGQRWNVKVIGGTGIGESGAQFVSHMGIVSKRHCKIWKKDFVKLPTDIIDTIFRDLELLFRWDRTANTDKEMLMHMSSMHRTWRGVLMKQHYTGKFFDDAIASVPAGVNPQDWQIMCTKWNTSDEQNIADRNKANRSHQFMPYRKGKKSHYQLKDDFRLAHDREPSRVEIFKIGRCKELPDGNEQWVDDESRSRFERMIQLSTPSLDSESGSTPISAKEAFVSVMGKDRSGRIRCGGSRETRRTWYGTGEGPCSTDYQQQISNIENTLRMKVGELRTEARKREAEMDEMQRELEQMRKR